jgi:hypothetical protein
MDVPEQEYCHMMSAWSMRVVSFEVRGRMRLGAMRTIIVAAGLVGTPALAQPVQKAPANDPAIVACEAVAHEQAGRPKQYARVRADLHGRTVVIDYRALGRRGRWELRQMQCAFRLDTKAAQWSFDPAKPAEVTECESKVEAATRVARRLRPQLRRCQKVLNADVRRQAVRKAAVKELVGRGQYPIPRAETGLSRVP